jgi:type I restriction enzyme, S subunit
VTDGLRPYSEYVDSGLTWLPKIPATWSVRRNGQLFAERKETGFAELPILEVSLKTGVRLRDMDSGQRKQVMADRAQYKRARAGDIAYNMMRMWQGAVGVAPVDGLVSPAYVVAKPLQETISRYFELLFRTSAYMQQVGVYSRGIVPDRNRLYWEDFKQIHSPCPPIDDQLAMVKFLGHADRLIRRCIGANLKLIKLLEEQKQATTHAAVTRGLDANVHLKPSGVELLGNVPVHWDVLPLRRRWSVTDCKHLTVPFVEQGVPLASVREVQAFSLCLHTAKRTTEEWYQVLIGGGRAPRRGDIIYCRNVSVGAAAIVETDERFAMGQDVCLIRSMDQNQRFLNYFLHSPGMAGQLAALMVGSTFDRINVEELKGLLIVVPPRSEQDEIVSHLDESLVGVDEAIGCLQREISLLREYNAWLICDVVTGKTDVRAAAMYLPNHIAEPESIDEWQGLGDADDVVVGELGTAARGAVV